MAKGKYQEWLTKDGLILLKKWARDGCTDKEIADNMGISRETFYKWKANYTDISDALKKTKNIVNAELEETTIKNAQEHEYEEVIITKRLNKDTGEMEVVEEKRIKKVMPSNPLLLMFLMKNRMPEQYKDKQDVAVSGAIPTVISGAEKLED